MHQVRTRAEALYPPTCWADIHPPAVVHTGCGRCVRLHRADVEAGAAASDADGCVVDVPDSGVVLQRMCAVHHHREEGSGLQGALRHEGGSTIHTGSIV